MQTSNPTISSAQVNTLINNKKTLYYAVVRNDFLVPPLSDEFCSLEYLDGLRTGRNWLPKATECKLYTCLFPPKR